MSQRLTALITGASVGIGRALALEFAKANYNLVLVSRNESALSLLAEQCRRDHGVDTFVMGADLSRPESAGEIFNWVSTRGITVDALVNNAGFGIHGAFLETEVGLELEMITIQLTSLLQLTKLFLPAMVKKRSGRILNVASVYAFAPVPYQSVYAACKAFMLSFSESLASEVASSGVTVTVLCPGVTRTEFRKRAGIREKSPTSGMSAEQVAAIGFRATTAGKLVSVPGLVNQLFVFVARHLPIVWLARLMRVINRARGVNH